MNPLPTPDAVLELIRSRRTLQIFRPDPVALDVVHRALEAARWAPNHKLTQPWRFYLLGPATRKAVVALNAELTEAERGVRAANLKRERWGVIPGWLVVTCTVGTDPLREREDYAACCCAIQNFMLYLWSEGVASKWTTGAVVREPEFYATVGIPSRDEFVVGMVWYGYSTEQRGGVRDEIERFVVERP